MKGKVRKRVIPTRRRTPRHSGPQGSIRQVASVGLEFVVARYATNNITALLYVPMVFSPIRSQALYPRKPQIRTSKPPLQLET